MTLIEWISTFDAGFSIFALLTFLVSAVALAFAVLGLLPELKYKPSLPGGVGQAAQWANQPAPQFGQHGHSGPQQDQYGQQGQPTGEQPGAFASQTDLGQAMDTSAPGFPTGNMGGPAGAPQEGQQDGSNKTTLW